MRPQPAQPMAQPGLRPPPAAPANMAGLKPFEQVLALMGQYNASDLHLKANCPVIMRISGIMRPLAGRRSLGGHSPAPRRRRDARAAQGLRRDGRRRLCAPLPDRVALPPRMHSTTSERTPSSSAGSARRSPSSATSTSPRRPFERISSFDDGLVILAGVTGSGKSTTIAAILDGSTRTTRGTSSPSRTRSSTSSEQEEFHFPARDRRRLRQLQGRDPHPRPPGSRRRPDR